MKARAFSFWRFFFGSAILFTMFTAPARVLAVDGFTVQIVAGTATESCKVVAHGSDQHILTVEEKDHLFGLSDQAIKNAAGKEMGKVPANAFLGEKDGMFAKYGWKPVQVVTTVKSAEIIDFSSKPIVVNSTLMENNLPDVVPMTTKVSHEVSNTIETSWSKSVSKENKQTLHYGFSWLGGGNEWTDTETWGVEVKKSTTYVLGSCQEITVPVRPKSAAKAFLSASQATMHIKIVYVSSLVGNVGINYDPQYKAHYWWALDVGNVMSDAGINNAVETSQIISVDYYTDALIRVDAAELKAPSANAIGMGSPGVMRAMGGN